MARLRKLGKAEGQQRRSPRISALEASCMVQCRLDNNDQGPPALRTRGKKKKTTKLMMRPLQQLAAASPNQSTVKHEDIQKKNVSDQPSKSPSVLFLPNKRILELVLDTLQRRDAYEIFAEPVDPNEVEDYNAIIKEPMDFGTMRAKLHEGMYKTLEQFEHDVFLIFNNAMHFNSSGTIYFRQARVINELAKKVFDVLRINPEKFEMDFSETKQQAGRRNQGGDFRNSTHMKSSKITITGVPSKNMPCSSQGTSSRRSFRTNHGCLDTTAKRVRAGDVDEVINAGAKDSSRCMSFEVDHRCCAAYKPLSRDVDESSRFSIVCDKLKLLEHVNQQDIGYKESLMLFVKDLGPTAQNIAQRKLLGCEIRTAAAAAANIAPPRRTNPFNLVSASSALNQFPDRHHPNKIKSRPTENIGLEEGTLSAERDQKGLSNNPSLDGNTTKGSHKWSSYSWGNHKVFPYQSFCSNNSQYYSRAGVENLKCSNNHGSKETHGKMMLLDKSSRLLVNQEKLSGRQMPN